MVTCDYMRHHGFDYYGEGLLTQEVSRPFWVLTVTAKRMLASLTLLTLGKADASIALLSLNRNVNLLNVK